MISQDDLKNRIEKLGWVSLDEHLWEKLNEFCKGVAILAPPLDTVPSPHGNAIYTIIQDYAERSPEPCLVLSIWPEQGAPQKCGISDRILYIKKPFKSVPFEEYIPYRIKKYIWGTGRPELLNFALKAAKLCDLISVNKIVVEDVPIFGLILKRNLGIKSRIILHQHIDAPLSYSKTWWKKIRRAYSGFLFVAQKTLDDTEKKHGKLKNAIIVYNGVDLSHYDPERWRAIGSELRAKYSIGEKENVVLFVGRVIPGKGCLELSKAFLQANVPNSRLILIGDLFGSAFMEMKYSTELKSFIEISNNKIISIGNVPQKDIPGWYMASDLVVVPSIQSEGLTKVITEALSMGRPVLTTDRGGSLELIHPGKNGWLLKDAQNIDQFSLLLRGILTNPAEIAEFSQNAFQFDRPKLDINRSAAAFFRSI